LAGVRSGVFVNVKDHSVVTGPPGLTITDFGYIEWIPPISMSGKNVYVLLKNDEGKSETGDAIAISVLDADTVKGEAKGETFTVNDETSDLHGYIFRFSEKIPTEFLLREVPHDSLPRLRGVSYQLPGGFYSLSRVPIELYVPTSVVTDISDIPSLDVFGWSNADPLGINTGGWSSVTLRKEGEIIRGKSYIKFTLPSTNFLGVIAKTDF